ncbi:MAG: CoA ester lyase [Burkholderiaceae bacterium]
MRSKLFVPASRPELFDKAVAGQADALSFDLEDAVAPERKGDARAALATWLRSDGREAGGKTVIVRVNGVSTPWLDDDLAAVVTAGVHWINLPKTDTAETVRDVARRIARAAAAQSLPTPPRLLLNIETPRALRFAPDLACADPLVGGLQLGLGDLFEPLAIARHHEAAVAQAMFALRLAAGEAGIIAVDAAYADFSDLEGFQAEAALARALGYVGKSCIHPRQVAIANDVFKPTEDEIADAREIVAAADAAEARGVGAYVVRGRMVDAPFARRARDLLALAGRLNLDEPDRRQRH